MAPKKSAAAVPSVAALQKKPKRQSVARRVQAELEWAEELMPRKEQLIAAEELWAAELVPRAEPEIPKSPVEDWLDELSPAAAIAAVRNVSLDVVKLESRMPHSITPKVTLQ